MKTKELKKTVFVSEDGAEFLDYDECVDHVRKCDLEKAGLTTDKYDNFEEMFRVGCVMDDDEYITEAYEKFIKKLAEYPDENISKPAKFLIRLKRDWRRLYN